MENCLRKFKIFKNGFTLAEVLITLVIIGVVAALTIPTVIANHRATQLRTQFKKSVSNLENALRMMQFKEPHWQTNLNDWINEESSQDGKNGNDAANRIGVLMMSCFNGAEGKVGQRNTSRRFKDYYKNYQNNLNSAEYGGVFGYFDTVDGMTIYPECSGNCNPMFIFVDINGFNKKPNQNGHDLFAFEINKENGMLIPATLYGSNCNRTDNYSGFDCTKQAIYDENYFKNLPK